MNSQYNDGKNTLELIPVYHKISIDSIQKHCLILPYLKESQYVMEIADQELWANNFSAV